MYCLYVGFNYTYIDINTLVHGIKSFLASSLVSSHCWGSNLWYRFACNYQAATLTIVCMYVYNYCRYEIITYFDTFCDSRIWQYTWVTYLCNVHIAQLWVKLQVTRKLMMNYKLLPKTCIFTCETSFKLAIPVWWVEPWTVQCSERERNVLFNDALNTFYLRLYGIRHMVKDHSDSEKGNPLPPHRLLLSINSKGSFICTIQQTG